jgi:hypothetical protein
MHSLQEQQQRHSFFNFSGDALAAEDSDFADYLDEMIREGAELVKEASDYMDIEVKERKGEKRSRAKATAPAERVPNPNNQSDPGNIIWQLPDEVRNRISVFPAQEQLRALDQYMNGLLATLTVLQQTHVMAANTPLERFNLLKRFLRFKKEGVPWPPPK